MAPCDRTGMPSGRSNDARPWRARHARNVSSVRRPRSRRSAAWSEKRHPCRHRWRRSSKNGQTCGIVPACHVCANGECVAPSDGSSCKGVIGTCCAGLCCIGNQICCDGKCCDGTCIAGCCIGSSSASAAGTDLCCPFGPPCGEGNDERCCKEDEECCPEENVCGDACCSREVLEVCT